MFVATAPPHHVKDMRAPFKLRMICTVYDAGTHGLKCVVAMYMYMYTATCVAT